MTNLTLSKDQFLQLLSTDELYGLVLVDIHVPDHLKEYFEEFPPIFKNTIVTCSVLDCHIKEFAVANGIKYSGWRCVLASHFIEKVLLTTDYSNWCLICQLVVSKRTTCHDEPIKVGFVTLNKAKHQF